MAVFFVLALAASGCVVAPLRATHELRPPTGHRYPDHPPGSVAFARAADLYTRTNVQDDNRVAFLAYDAEIRPALDFLVDHAAERISCELVAGRDTAALDAFARRLADAAGRGVAVRVVLDGESDAQRLAWLEEFVAAGGQIRRLNPDALTRLRLRADNRSVRRFLVVDGCYALVGGMPGAAPAPGLLVGGAAAAALEEAFASQWGHAHRPPASRALPRSLVRAASGVIAPARILGRKYLDLNHRLFSPPPYIMPMLDDDRFDRALAAALLGRFGDADARAADDALAAVRWAATDFPPPPRVDPSASALPDAGPDPGAWALCEAERLEALVRELLKPPPVPGDSEARAGDDAGGGVPMLPAWSAALPAWEASIPLPLDAAMAFGAKASPQAFSDVPDAPPAEAEAPAGESAAGQLASAAVNIAKTTVLPIIAVWTMGFTLTINPPALAAANMVRVGVGMVKERRRRYVVAPEDTMPGTPEPIAPVDPAAVDMADARVAAWARHSRESMGVSPAWASVRMVPTRPDERTSAAFDMALLTVHGAKASLLLGGGATPGDAPRELSGALKTAAKRGVDVRRADSRPPGAWAVADGRAVLIGDAPWNRRGFFLRYSLSVFVDEPALARAVGRWLGLADARENAANVAAGAAATENARIDPPPPAEVFIIPPSSAGSPRSGLTWPEDSGEFGIWLPP